MQPDAMKPWVYPFLRVWMYCVVWAFLSRAHAGRAWCVFESCRFAKTSCSEWELYRSIMASFIRNKKGLSA